MSAKRQKQIRNAGAPAPEKPGTTINALTFAQFQNQVMPRGSELEKIEALSPGATGRILTAFESQIKHRQSLESFVISRDSARADRGQWLAFSIAIMAFVSGVYLVKIGQEIIGVATFVGSIGSLLLAFLGNANLRKKERENKRKEVITKKF